MKNFIFLVTAFFCVFQNLAFANSPSLQHETCLKLEGVEPQDDDWSCGPNVATRVLQYYGYNVTYDFLRKNSPKSLDFGPGARIGPAPAQLAAYMNQLTKEDEAFVVQQAADFASIKNFVTYYKKPVILLIKVGEKKINTGFLQVSFPLLHYIVLSSYDAQSYTFTALDSNDKAFTIDEKQLERRWNWTVENPLVRNILQNSGTVSKSFIVNQRR